MHCRPWIPLSGRVHRFSGWGGIVAPCDGRSGTENRRDGRSTIQREQRRRLQAHDSMSSGTAQEREGSSATCAVDTFDWPCVDVRRIANYHCTKDWGLANRTYCPPLSSVAATSGGLTLFANEDSLKRTKPSADEATVYIDCLISREKGNQHREISTWIPFLLLIKQWIYNSAKSEVLFSTCVLISAQPVFLKRDIQGRKG